MSEQLQTTTNPNLHRLVRSVTKALRGIKPNENGLLIPPHNGAFLDIRVSSSMLPRALQFLDDLLRAMEERGFAIAVGNQTVITVDGEQFHMRLDEKLSRVPWERSYAAQHKDRFLIRSIFPSKTGYAPSGLMRLTFLDPEYNFRTVKEWYDRPRKGLLEPRLAEIIEQLPVTVEKVRRERAEREERYKREEIEREARHQQWLIEEEERRKHREAAEAERRAREAELARVQRIQESIHTGARAWEECVRIRAYFDAIEKAAYERGLSIGPGTQLGDWLRWGREYADSIDPLLSIESLQLELPVNAV